jgi:hypothetical protein
MIIAFYLVDIVMCFDGHFFHLDRYRSGILFKLDGGEVLFCIMGDVIRWSLINVDLIKS